MSEAEQMFEDAVVAAKELLENKKRMEQLQPLVKMVQFNPVAAAAKIVELQQEVYNLQYELSKYTGETK